MQLSARRDQQVQELEAQMAQAEASVAVALPDADVFGPAPVPTAPTVSGHSWVLSVE